MAVQVSSAFRAAVKHPILSCGLLLLLLLPALQVLLYFFPLLLSTALCVAALVSLGGSPFFGEEEVKPSSDQSEGAPRRITRLKAWLWSKLKVQDNIAPEVKHEGDLIETRDGCGDSGESEHEKRVHQLERTLRTLSFVSYEGIFAPDGTLLDVDGAEESNAPQDAEFSAYTDDPASQVELGPDHKQPGTQLADLEESSSHQRIEEPGKET